MYSGAETKYLTGVTLIATKARLRVLSLSQMLRMKMAMLRSRQRSAAACGQLVASSGSLLTSSSAA